MSRRGFTLIEILLVLAVLTVLAGVSLPAVLRFTAEQGVKDAAEAVREELDQTRYRSIKAGLVYQFRFEVNGRRFVALPFEQDAASVAQPATAPVLGRLFAGRLADGYSLAPLPGTSASAEMLPNTAFAGLPDAFLLAQAQWSPPFLFYPDGSASAAEMRLTGPSGRYMDVTVRDLTGMAACGPLRQGGSQ